MIPLTNDALEHHYWGMSIDYANARPWIELALRDDTPVPVGHTRALLAEIDRLQADVSTLYSKVVAANRTFKNGYIDNSGDEWIPAKELRRALQ